MNKGLKFLRGHEIRKVHKLPPNYTSMQQTLYQLYGTTDLALTYIDDNNVKHTISSDEDLINAYEALKDKINFKFIIEDDKSSEPSDVLARIDFLRQSIADVSALKQDINFPKPDESDQNYSAPMIINESPIIPPPIENIEKPITPPNVIENPAVFQNTKCHGCSIEPITGILYRSTVSPNTDFCESCEQKNIYKYPLIKYRSEIGIENFHGFSMKELAKCFGKELGNALKEIKRKKYSVELVKEADTEISGTDKIIAKSWQIRNNGTKKWPIGTKVVFKKGSLIHIDSDNLSLNPGEVTNAEVKFKTPLVEGTHKGKWTIQVKPYKFIGKLSAKVKVLNLPEVQIEEIKQMIRMGVSLERALLSLI